MPYKDLERKRQWEREHREQRNARRRALRVTPKTKAIPKPAPDPAPSQQPTSGWKDILGLVVGAAILIVAAFAGASISADFGPSGVSGNPTK